MRTIATQRQFIEAWQTSSTVADVARKLKMKRAQVRVRASRYRKHGVPLKEYVPAELPWVDWEELAQFAAQLLAAPNGAAKEPSGAGT